MERSGKEAVDADRVRELLRQVLPGPRDVAAFCADQFPGVGASRRDGTAGGPGEMDRERQVERLLAQVGDRGEIVARLRLFAPNAAAWGPRRAVWPYVLCGLALLTALLGGFLAWRMTMARRPQSSSAPRSRSPGGPRAARAAALLPCGEPCYGARHKEAPCRPTACRLNPPGAWRCQTAPIVARAAARSRPAAA